MKIYMIIIIFLLIGAFFIISENHLSLNKTENIQKLGKLYLNWLGDVFISSGKIVGNIVKLNWLPENKTSG